MAGALGFEPRNGGTKNRCLTTWLRPKIKILITQLIKNYIVLDITDQYFLYLLVNNLDAFSKFFLDLQ